MAEFLEPPGSRLGVPAGAAARARRSQPGGQGAAAVPGRRPDPRDVDGVRQADGRRAAGAGGALGWACFASPALAVVTSSAVALVLRHDQGDLSERSHGAGTEVCAPIHSRASHRVPAPRQRKAPVYAQRLTPGHAPPPDLVRLIGPTGQTATMCRATPGFFFSMRRLGRLAQRHIPRDRRGRRWPRPSWSSPFARRHGPGPDRLRWSTAPSIRKAVRSIIDSNSQVNVKCSSRTCSSRSRAPTRRRSPRPAPSNTTPGSAPQRSPDRTSNAIKRLFSARRSPTAASG